jgi:threonine dehydrogenase-like Zn-dependent dehydrogenase
MAPVPKLVANAIKTSADKAIINIFAGIPASINGPLDLNLYISKKMYLIGTSGSTIEDMKILLDKVQTNRLDTNISVAAVCGLNHAADGIRAVENHKIPGKIIIYPVCKDLPLTPLTEIHKQLPDVAEKLVNGLWNAKAEKAFIKHFS